MKAGNFLVGVIVGILGTIGASLFAQGVLDVRSGPAVGLSIATTADGAIVYAANPNGFFKSRDGGETWQKLPVE